MACPRGVTGLFGWSLILTAALVLLVPSTSAQSCIDIFSSTSATLSGFDDTVLLEINVEETTSSGTELYTLTWTDDCVDPPTITDESFNDYFTVNDTDDCMWVVTVNTALTGVPDYPSPQSQMSTEVMFTGFTTITGDCSVTLTHKIMDENTQKPTPEATTYTLDIPENLNTGYTIPEFNTSVHDQDGTEPNNQFSVSVNDGCPLESTLLTYTSGLNARPVEYKLREPLDFEVLKIITCDVTFEDKGTPPLTDTATITINVVDVNDEPPVFSYAYYYSEVSSVLNPGDPLDIYPDPIMATDGDTGINAIVTYALENANPDVDGLEYFSIKGNTGEVALIKDLDNDFLLNERVLFIVQASDGMLTAPAILDVTLPPVPTTTASTTIASTTPDTTCEPCTCPTYTTELLTDCPTTPTEATCTPCPTDTTMDCTCPVVTCPTTPTEGPTTTTIDPTVTWDPALPPLTFKKESYVGDIYASFSTVFDVEVENNEGYGVTYSLRGTGSEHFTIVGNSIGTISVNEADPPPVNTYEMEALAVITSTPTERATTRIVIHVLPQSFDEVAILSSIIRASVSEGEGQQELGTVTLSDSANIVCVKGAEPSNLKDLFTVEKESDRVWKLKKSGALDYEQTKEITLALQAYTGGGAPTDCNTFNEDIPAEFSKSEALAIITVTDTDDEAPVFSSGDLVAAYPTNEGLKRVVGPVVSVHADDKDTEDLKYSVAGENAAQFTVDEETGDVYGVEGLSCDSECVFSVTASDGTKQDQVNVKVLPLNTDHVFTFMMPNTALSAVDDKLQELSNEAGSQISKLYVSATKTTTRRGRTRYRRDTTTTLEVHVYSIKDGALMSREELNSALTDGSSGLQAETFNDAEVFEVEVVDTTGLTVAVGVLGALLGVVLIAGVGFFVYQKKKGKAAPSPVQPSPPINTLGQAYSNPSFSENNQVNLGSGSVGHKSNGSLNGYPGGSLNGYTSAEVHRHADHDSPPLHRSPLAQPSDNIPLRTRDTQPQGGLMRTNPSPPEYYGSSSPAPPPSFSSSTSPSYPIYAEIKKPKDSKKKIMDDTDDEDERRSTKFASVKDSPPPRRSNKQDDYDDDESDDVAYPGGKHVGFGEEPAEDEKKSVAFKVKVETKEIEAENMGPAQKKAEATKLMEANRKKLEEERDDEDDEEEEEEEESMKL
ncbi:protocadherin Fat 4-like isoform X5 [Eriocheir sinensis]|uniref:protocadherin Fat 4-like isoform X5 n=1 Tax=Eriocheir sinensis TaxID=95602 RepID=UPI0021C6A853|nr:protocadherin Fat 4-like isoform X5 [Eriocheir sinensis]